MIIGSRYASKKTDPHMLSLKPGVVEGNLLILTTSKPKYSKYLREWHVDYTAYAMQTPCQCCGQSRGAGSLHP